MDPNLYLAVGITVTESSVELARSDKEGEIFSFTNDADGHAQVIAMLKSSPDPHGLLIAVLRHELLELTLVLHLVAVGFRVMVTRAEQVKQLMPEVYKPNAHASVDARLLARFARVAGLRLGVDKFLGRALRATMECNEFLKDIKSRQQNHFMREDLPHLREIGRALSLQLQDAIRENNRVMKQMLCIQPTS